MVLKKLVIALALLAAPVAAADYKPLFDGASFDGWTPVGGAVWSVKDGMITGEQGPANGFLVSKQRYRDFELRAEFWISETGNSGIFIRCADPANITLDNAYEVNIWDTRPDPSYATGAIVNVAKVSPVPKTGGQWNVMLIRAEGDRFIVEVNGRRTVDGARDARSAEGAVALQLGLGTVKFRKVEIRPL